MLSPESAAAVRALSSQHRGSGEAGQEGCSLLLLSYFLFPGLGLLGWSEAYKVAHFFV